MKVSQVMVHRVIIGDEIYLPLDAGDNWIWWLFLVLFHPFGRNWWISSFARQGTASCRSCCTNQGEIFSYGIRRIISSIVAPKKLAILKRPSSCHCIFINSHFAWIWIITKLWVIFFLSTRLRHRFTSQEVNFKFVNSVTALNMPYILQGKLSVTLNAERALNTHILIEIAG